MTRFIKKTSSKIGKSPGTLIHIGDKKSDASEISVMAYSPSALSEWVCKDVAELLPLASDAQVTWINIDGIYDISLMERIGELFGIHPLTLEDILNTTHRPKAEVFEDYLFIVLKMLTFEEDNRQVISEQVSLIIGNGYILSFQEKQGDIFDTVRERIRMTRGRIRSMGGDYLAYCLIDKVVDHYFLILEAIGSFIEEMEDTIIDNPSPEIIQNLHSTKREMIYLRKQIWPLREVVGEMTRDDIPFISHKTTIFLRDVYDHTIQIIDTIESMRDVLSGMLDIYLSSVSNRMNNVMKVLTIFSTVFMPLSFLAAVYGMNFKYFPELEFKYGYFIFWGVVAGIALGMMGYFRKKKWL